MKIIFKHEVKTADKLSGTELVEILLKNRNIKNLKEFLDPINPAKSGSEIENIKAGIFKFFIKIIVALYIVNISTYISK